MTQRYPLSWPAGWPRTAAHHRKPAPFNKKVGWETKNLSVADATQRLQRELELLRADDYLLSTNMELRLDGLPRSDRLPPADPGAAIYFRLKGKDTALACDKWNRVADNIAALAKHIEALRGIDRWGVGSVAQAFAGYQALPSPEQWWQVLGFASGNVVDRDAIEAAYRRLAREAHPDTGGSHAAMSRLNAARDQGLKEIC